MKITEKVIQAELKKSQDMSLPENERELHYNNAKDMLLKFLETTALEIESVDKSNPKNYKNSLNN